MRHLYALLAFALVGLTAGCTVGAPTTGFGMTHVDTDAGGGTQHNDNPDMAPLAEVTKPQLDTYSQTTVFDTVPIRGTATPPNSAVIITAMDGTPTSADVDSGGRFCANLVLQHNKANIFQLKTHDSATGRESESFSIEVQQSGTPNAGSQGAQSYNASAGGAGTAYQIGTNGTSAAQQVTDGDTHTDVEAEFEGNWFSHTAVPSVMVRFQQGTSINKIVAVLPSDCAESGKLTLAYSAQSAPVQPDVNAAGWITVPVTKSSDGKTFSANMTAANATYIAAWWGAGTSGCSTIVTDPEYGTSSTYYGLAELQGWSTPGATTPPAVAPSCGQ